MPEPAADNVMDLTRIANEQRFFIPGPLPSLNQMLDARVKKIAAMSRGKARVDQYTLMKKEWTRICAEAAIAQGIKPVESCYFTFHWQSKDRRTEKDNLAVARKFILDGLELARIMKDHWDNVVGWTDTFEINKKEPGVLVVMWPSE